MNTRHVVSLLSAIAIAITTYFLAAATGFSGAQGALASVFAGALFGGLVASSGVKALWLPAAGLATGLAGIVVVQLVSSASIFPFTYYLFVPTLAALVVTLVGSALLLLHSSSRKRLFGAPNRVPRG